jgi:hypothetical protein
MYAQNTTNVDELGVDIFQCRYNSHDIDIPGGVIALFVVTLLASVWSFWILLAVLRARNTALWIAFWDIVAMGALIASVAVTSEIATYECNAVPPNTVNTVYITSDGRRFNGIPADVDDDDRVDLWDDPDNCNLVKAAWGLAIANIIMFFITAILAVVVYRQNMGEMRNTIVEDAPVVEKIYTSPAGYPERPRRARRSHRSSRSSRPRSVSRTYVYNDRL